MICEEGYLKVMLDRSVWHRIYQCLELFKCNELFNVNDFLLLDEWLKNRRIEVMKFSIGEIENYHRKPSFELDAEAEWLKRKEIEYNIKIHSSTMYMNDANSPTNTLTVCVGIGDVEVPPNVLKDVMDAFGISIKKERDVLSLIIAEKIKADIFIHHNPKDFERDPQIQNLITARGMVFRIMALATVFHEIRGGRL